MIYCSLKGTNKLQVIPYVNSYYKDNIGKCKLDPNVVDNDTTVYQCREYEGVYTCNSKSQCEYTDKSYNYCTSLDNY